MVMEILAWLAAALVFVSFFMRTIVPLRTFAVASNIVFIGYGLQGVYEDILPKVLPILVLHAALLPLNVVRLREITRTTRSIRTIQETGFPYDFLLPFMASITRQAGTDLFCKGDHAKEVYVLKSGTVYLKELGKSLGPGALFGEVAVFSEDAVRVATAHCQTDCELFSITGEKVLELFYQDRNFSFKIARLLAGYATERQGLGPA